MGNAAAPKITTRSFVFQHADSGNCTHLELLGIMIAYWREAEAEGEVRAPEPDPIQ
jgi:hypothetical protein